MNRYKLMTGSNNRFDYWIKVLEKKQIDYTTDLVVGTWSINFICNDILYKDLFKELLIPLDEVQYLYVE